MSNNEIAKKESSEIIQKLVLDGDLSKMTGQQKVIYYNQFCESLGLNPLTQPFQLIKFQGKERLYAAKDCTEQLRKINGVSITDISTTSISDVFIVTAKALDKQGKTDCSTGAVNIKGLSGDNLANALMKAETKAKRRVTLSICGLGILDETETDTMQDAKKSPVTEDVSAIVTEPSDINDETLSKWAEEINKCNSKGDLLRLWNGNFSKTEADTRVKEMFKAKEVKLKNNAAGMTYADARENQYDRS